MTPAAERHTVSLLSDGALTLEVADSVAHAVARWRPRPGPAGGRDAPSAGRGAKETTTAPAARIRVLEAERTGPPAPASAPMLQLGNAAAWGVGRDDGRVVLGRPGGGVDGRIDLAARCAELALPASPATAGTRPPGAGDRDGAPVDAYSLLTISAALLLGRLGRALVHAAAVVAPDGYAWLLVGDARAGKTTTVANLIRAGWDWLSDDQVVLAPASGVLIEGWPRAFHLDQGWPDSEPTGDRRAADPDDLGPGRRRTAAPLCGLLFPRVDAAGDRTLAERIGAGDALARLVRQSPWLLADREAAGPVLALLHAAVAAPAHAVTLGRDAYADATPVLRALHEIV